MISKRTGVSSPTTTSTIRLRSKERIPPGRGSSPSRRTVTVPGGAGTRACVPPRRRAEACTTPSFSTPYLPCSADPS